MVELLFSALAIYIIYYNAIIIKFDKNGNLKRQKKNVDASKDKKELAMENYMALPVEVKFFVKKYNVDLDKINNRGLLKLMGLVLGIDIAIITVIVGLIIQQDILIQVLIASLMLIPCYILSLALLAKYFKKKGLIKNEGIKKSKGNRK